MLSFDLCPDAIHVFQCSLFLFPLLLPVLRPMTAPALQNHLDNRRVIAFPNKVFVTRVSILANVEVILSINLSEQSQQ